LQEAALKQGLTPAEAVARAAEQLGDPRQLAERHVEVLRLSSWLTKNPLLSFGVLPLAAIVALGLFFAQGLGGKLFLDDAVTGLYTKTPWIYPWMGGIFYGSLLAITAFATFYFCRRSQSLAMGRRWMWVIGGVLAAHGLFVQIQPLQRIVLSHDVTVQEDKVAPGRLMTIEASGLGNDWLSPFLLYHSSRNIPRPGDAETRVDLEFIQIVKPGAQADPGFTPLQDSILQAQIAKSLAEIQEDQWNHRLTSLWEPGWTLIKAWLPHHEGEATSQASLEAYTPQLFDAIKRAGPHVNSPPGQLRWLGDAHLTVSLPVFYYSFPLISAGDWLHWFNVALPLVMVAGMLAWERRGVKRLERESELDGARVVGVA